MHIDHVVVAGRCTHKPNASGNVEIHDSDLDIERLDQTCQTDLPRAAPGLRYHNRRNTQRSSAMPELINPGQHEMSFCRLVQGEECTCIEGKT
jgi:hypothetical protein